MPTSGEKRTDRKTNNNNGSFHLITFRYGQFINNTSQFCCVVSGPIIYI